VLLFPIQEYTRAKVIEVDLTFHVFPCFRSTSRNFTSLWCPTRAALPLSHLTSTPLRARNGRPRLPSLSRVLINLKPEEHKQTRDLARGGRGRRRSTSTKEEGSEVNGSREGSEEGGEDGKESKWVFSLSSLFLDVS
jgi:hypothetical protein